MEVFATIDADYLEQRKTLIRQTWRAVEFGMGDKMTSEFFDQLLTQFPEVKQFFSETDLGHHSPKIYGIIKLAVRSLDDFESMVPVLQDLGKRHGRIYGLNRSHYRAFTTTFIEVMHKFIHTQYCEMMVDTRYVIDVADAWSFVLNLIGEIMVQAAEEMPSAA